eukprot:TRINITY_DN45785_c0_g1_i1.p1 TRINITY_DN45785_c0_g1~~TRINITY_DN45785_c0_g1_i1.p1  ORF type:complete len:371 (-),score=103.34 TRINITY_DN45785_c0_g1_i1:37-1104(-)
MAFPAGGNPCAGSGNASGKGGYSGRGRGGGKARGKGSKGGGGRGGGPAQQPREDDWDASQRRSLESAAARSPLDLTRRRPQRPVEAFPGLTVAADWPERRAPRSGSAFYLPLIWTALLQDELDGARGGAAPSAARRQLDALGDAKHFHHGAARRCTLEELRSAQEFWVQVFSGWRGWARRLRAAINGFPGGCDGVVANYVQRTSVTACAVVYGDIAALGALPHISNARNSPHQDAILELDFALRCELEASVATLFLPGGEAFAAAAPAAPAALPAGAAATTQARDLDGAARSGDAVEGAAGATEAEKEILKLRKKLREIEKLKEKPSEELDFLQRNKVEGENIILAKLRELGAEA